MLPYWFGDTLFGNIVAFFRAVVVFYNHFSALNFTAVPFAFKDNRGGRRFDIKWVATFAKNFIFFYVRVPLPTFRLILALLAIQIVQQHRVFPLEWLLVWVERLR